MVTPSQLQLVADALVRLAEHPHKGWLHNADPDAAVAYVRATVAGETESQCAVVGGVFVMYTTGKQWWARRPVLIEQLLLRIEPGELTQTLAFLERLSELLECAGVVLGTSISTNDAALTRLLQRRGYALCSNALYKETPCHLSSSPSPSCSA